MRSITKERVGPMRFGYLLATKNNEEGKTNRPSGVDLAGGTLARTREPTLRSEVCSRWCRSLDSAVAYMLHYRYKKRAGISQIAVALGLGAVVISVMLIAFVVSMFSVEVEVETKPVRVNKDLPRVHSLILKNGELAKIKGVLVQKPNLLNERDRLGRLPIHVAALSGRVSLVKLLIENGACVNAEVAEAGLQYHGARPVHFAAERGHLNVISLLEKNSAEICVQTVRGARPIHFVPDDKYADVKKYLRKKCGQERW